MRNIARELKRFLLPSGRLGLAAMLGCVIAVLFASPAQATFHLIYVSEVYPGSAAQPQSSFVELQMYDDDENFVGGRSVTLQNSAGAVTGTFTFPDDLPGTSVDQQKILVGDDGVEAAFGVKPDLISSAFNISGSGGAACWEGLDCVSWGTFSGTTSPPSGTPAPVIADGFGLTRLISGGTCSNRLDEQDDTNESDRDFVSAAPTPQNYSTVPSAPDCIPAAPTPVTTIDTNPPSTTNSTSANFSFHATPTATDFECRLDLAPYADCDSGTAAYAGPLSEGLHTFRVRGSNGNGTGASAVYSWKVDLTPPSASITSQPPDPSPGKSVTFRYSSTEGGSKFECRLTPLEATFTLCTSQPKVYSSLANGAYEFEVRAIDLAGNVQTSPTVYAWSVDNSLADATPPETTILSKPPDPSTSSAASFTYASNEPGSTFQCKLDGEGFSSCPATGVSYAGLAEGAHAFQVRAVDASNNVDPTPAGYSFNVVLSPAPLAPPLAPPSPAPAKPNTSIAKGPTKLRDRTPTFRFSSNRAGASFQCKLDRGRFVRCRSPYTTKVLSYGPHTLTVRAVAGGSADPSPAKLSFKVVKG
jgi:hypothetical protein